ncbi:ABC transporter substrate-binding protein [Deinococcus metallilatus]|uniref:ABC transporter substrate-binding protein n=1 Tax=Deinococcus metallilatus TaxID=1211322 RepID=A0AAJ5F436_9DEIO|nr:ABC transporter substrate-binding protein [Deinococcus metallilatus]MBB5294407.1 iron complex transport system substrate-binding protein [Deinococcus metallilatus]QBY10160.1 ABC transporter substrate-binding protein [Deinococcus metallilatus]RXJ13886.1 ABC transporter substrate-binding protein [Deinococcus metallilatus]TLK29852.1 ABC transporter substrate-binding protein [Deinococcus metallilatus]GMA15623.1 ABC transporter substrate-binding protein [Deinococcus metallilatus]
MRSLALLSALALLSSAAATKYPLTVTDDLGRTVTLPGEPQRIIAMLPSHTETLVAIGAGDKLVAVDRFSNFPKNVTDRLPKVGSAYQPNLEAILALKPDLVLADESSGSRLTEKLAQAGLTVYGGSAQTYNEVFEKIGVLGKLTNHEAGALKLITSLRADLNALQQSVLGLPKVSTYYEVDPSPYSVGPDSFIGTLIAKAGGRTIVPARLGDFPKLDPELIVQANPQAMIGLSPDDARKRSGWANLQAVRTGRVFLPSAEERDALSRPGPRLPVALRALIRWLHPEALK